MEVSYLEKFLPQKLGEAETMALVQAAIEATGATDMKQMGMQWEGGRPESRHG